VKMQPAELTTQEFKQSLEQTRERVLKDIRVLERELYAAVDFKNWVQEPWLWVAGAFGIGFLWGVLSSRRK